MRNWKQNKTKEKMAIYYFSSTIISRSQGRTAMAAAAYRSGERLHDERQDRTVDYSRKQDVVYKEILLPEKAPSWMADREKLWNAVEKAENRKDSQLAREITFSLPRELSSAQNIELAKEFVKDEFVSRGMIADLCVHEGKTKDGEEQPHVHLMLTMREVAEEGFGQKERSWNAKENLLLWRESWAEYANKCLALNGIDERIDHRSNAELGIDLIPQNKIGGENLRINKQKVEEHKLIAQKNGEKILDDPNIALNAITHYRSTFTHQDLARFINRYTVDVDQFQLVYDKVKSSDQIVQLGKDDRGHERLTTVEMVEIEKQMLTVVSALDNQGHAVRDSVREDIQFVRDVPMAGERAEKIEHEEGSDRSVSSAAPSSASLSLEEVSVDGEDDRISLSTQQKEALDHMIDHGDIKCIVGYAGTGKSHLLAQTREAWEGEGYKVHGATLSGIAAESLEGASGIESRTLASRFYYWDTGRGLDKNDVLVIDEAGMLGTRQMAKVVNEVKSSGAKLVLVGDPQQLQAIEAGAAFRAIISKTNYVELTEIRRQQELWQQNATKSFAVRDIKDAIDRYNKYDHVHSFESQSTAKDSLVSMWNDVRMSQPDKTQIMLSYTRRDVHELNERAREIRKQNNELGEDRTLLTIRGSQPFTEGDRIYFLRNNRDLGVMNGSLGTIERIKDTKLTVITDKEDLKGNKREISFDLEYYNHITHGYAATIHKAQGVTVDRSYVLASKHLDSHAVYVGMSRHRESADLFWSKEEFSNEQNLYWNLAKDRSKDIALDYLGFEMESKELDSDTILVVDVQGRAVTASEEYTKLKETYLEERARTDYHSDRSYDAFEKQCPVEDRAKAALDNHLGEVSKDIELLKHLNQNDEKLFSEMNERVDDKFMEILKEESSKESFTKDHGELENNSLSVTEKVQKISEIYVELKQAYLDARVRTDRASDRSYEEFEKQCPIEDKAKDALENYLGGISKDMWVLKHLSQNNKKLFSEMNNRFDDKLIEILKEEETKENLAKEHAELGDNSLSVIEKAQKISETYDELKQAYLDARKRTDYASDHSHEDFLKLCPVEDRAKASLDNYLGGISRDTEALKYLSQNNEKLFTEMNDRFDGNLEKALKEYGANEKFTKEHTEFEDRALSIGERFNKISEKYAELKQVYIEARARTDYYRDRSHDDFLKQCPIEDRAQESLDRYAYRMCQEKGYMDHISKHDEKLFNEVNKKFNEIERDHLRELQRDLELSR